MILKHAKSWFFSVVIVSCFTNFSMAYTDIEEKQIHVTMRMIGHEVLLCNGDSVSLILAIEKVKDRYKIEFSSEFTFNPEDLAPIISRNLLKAGISDSYIVEVEECSSQNVIYSYQVGGSFDMNIMPCIGRAQPKACYKLFITLLEQQNQLLADNSADLTIKPNRNPDLFDNSSSSNITTLSLFSLPIIFLIGLFIVYLKRKTNPTNGREFISIGAFHFDKINMHLIKENQITELTSKESDLLNLLQENANETVERDAILSSVWGDDGDYVGRTLDVFISKLRKKLEADPSLKIINIRGVGYKLILNATTV